MPLTTADREALAIVKGLLEKTAEHFTVVQLVRKSGLNADKLKTGFKFLYGIPMHQYYLHYKMNSAKKLLSETDMQVAEIGYALGYDDANNFSAAFKRVVGVKPGEWRKGVIRDR